MAESRDDDWSVVVVSSTRSTAWSPAIGTPWSSRHSHAAVSCQKKLLVMGGFDAQLGSLNDVWSSPDGREWEQLPAAAWSARDGHRAVVKDGAVYVLGGADKYQDPMECLNDVWKSEDAGETWALLSATGHKPNHWIGRWQHGATVHYGPARGGSGDSSNGENGDGSPEKNKNSSNNNPNGASPPEESRRGSRGSGTSRGSFGYQPEEPPPKRTKQLVVIGGWGEHGYLSDVCKCSVIIINPPAARWFAFLLFFSFLFFSFLFYFSCLTFQPFD